MEYSSERIKAKWKTNRTKQAHRTKQCIWMNRVVVY